MSFDFDAGEKANPAAEGIADAWFDAVTDAAGGPSAPRHKVLKAAANQIINDIWDHKSTDGVRNMFWRRNGLLFEMAASEPAAHDDVIENLHERLTLLKEAPQKAAVGRAPLNMRTKPETLPKEKNYNGF